MITLQPATLNTMRALTAEGIGLGRTDQPVEEEAAAATFERRGYVDVHIGNTVDLRLSKQQAQEIEAVHSGNTAALSPSAQRLLENMKAIESHQYRFVLYEGQHNPAGNWPYGNYHATYQTAIPTSLAMVEIERGFPSGSGTWGYQQAIGYAPLGEHDGQVDKHVKEAYFTSDEVAHVAADFRAQDKVKP